MKHDKFMIAGLITVLLFLIINIISTITTMSDYESRKESGNERWKQVENRILQTEEKVQQLEEEIKEWNK